MTSKIAKTRHMSQEYTVTLKRNSDEKIKKNLLHTAFFLLLINILNEYLYIMSKLKKKKN